jgi:hypothetical protein
MRSLLPRIHGTCEVSDIAAWDVSIAQTSTNTYNHLDQSLCASTVSPAATMHRSLPLHACYMHPISQLVGVGSATSDVPSHTAGASVNFQSNSSKAHHNPTIPLTRHNHVSLDTQRP